jgi:hypothetical protein
MARTTLETLAIEHEKPFCVVEALDSLLFFLSESILVESEDSLLRLILKLGPVYRGFAETHLT